MKENNLGTSKKRVKNNHPTPNITSQASLRKGEMTYGGLGVHKGEMGRGNNGK